MVEVKNSFRKSTPTRRFAISSFGRLSFRLFGSSTPIQGPDDMHYHENDDHIFMVLEGEGLVRTPHKEYTMKQFDIVVLTAGALSALQHR